MRPRYLSAHEVSEALREGNLSPEDYVYSIYENIRRLNNKLNAYISLRPVEVVLEEVKKSIKIGGKLSGALVAVKDNISTKGIRTTCASRMLENYVPPYDATVVELLKREGAVIIGKTNMDEFAMGSTTETSYFGPSRNPWNLSKVPGGSSGGSAVAISAYLATVSLGSDTGGSIRCPAAYTGIYGLKPTYGLVSRYGLVAYANSLEQIGPMARNTMDLALLLSVIASYDSRDATTIPGKRPDYYRTLGSFKMDNLRIGVVREMFGEGVDKRVAKTVLRVVDKLGFEVEEVSLPSLKYALPAYYVIAMSEASSNLARFDGVRYGFRAKIEGDWNTVYSMTRARGFGWEVKRRILLGTFALSAGYYEQYYLKALKIRRLIVEDFNRAFKDHGVLVGPTMPIPAFDIGEKIKDPLTLYMVDVETVPANLAGIPALSVPAGFVDSLPIGLQIMGPILSEPLLLNVSAIIEETTGLRNLLPPGA